MIVAVEKFLEVDPFVLFVGHPQRASSHPAGHREPPQVGRLRYQFDRARHVFPAGDQSLAFQGLEVADNAVGGADFERQPDLSHRRTVAPRVDLVADESVDFQLP